VVSAWGWLNPWRFSRRRCYQRTDSSWRTGMGCRRGCCCPAHSPLSFWRAGFFPLPRCCPGLLEARPWQRFWNQL